MALGSNRHRRVLISLLEYTDFSYSFIGCQVTALPAMTMTYVIDSYKPIAGL